MLRQERRDGRQERVITGFLRGIALLGLPPDGDRTIDTPGGEDTLLQVWPLVLAIAIGDPKGALVLLGLLGGQILSVDGDRGGIKVDRALVAVQDLLGPDGAGREHLHRARVIEPIQDPPHGVIIKGTRRDGLAQQQGRILVGKELCQTVQGTATAQGVEDHAQDNGPWIDGHLSGHQLIDHLDYAYLVGIRLHDGQMLDLVRFDRW